VIDGGLGISYLSFELDDFSLSLCPQLADCRPPFKASNFSINDCGMARYATLKPTLAWIAKDL